MNLPTSVKTWTFTVNQRSVAVSLLSCTKDVLYGLSQAWLAMSGASCKGSSNGTTAAMDGVNRWSSATAIGARTGTLASAGTSWLVITCANMGGIDIALSFIGAGDAQARIAYSAGGTYAVAGTATFHPVVSNTDEVELLSAGATPGNVFINDQTVAGDRIWHTAVATDGSALWWMVGKSFQITCGGLIQLCTSAVRSPATFSPAVVGFGYAGNGTTFTLAQLQVANGSLIAKARANNGTADAVVTWVGGIEAYAGSANAPFRISNVTGALMELQGSGIIMFPVGAWSETGTTRGKLGNLIDFWAVANMYYTGSTLPGDDTRSWVLFGNYALPWNGSAVVMA